MSNPISSNPLLEKAFITAVGSTPETESARSEIFDVLSHYLDQTMTPEEVNNRLETLTRIANPLQKINEVMQQMQQMQSQEYVAQTINYQKQNQFAGFRKRSSKWTEEEDERLRTAIQNHGSDNWSLIASYVGGQRTKSQCSQRWRRVLDPKIDKTNWKREEEIKLIEAVHSYGNKAWTRIAAEMGNRTDVQCRFRYKFLQKKAAQNHTELQPIASLQSSGIAYIQAAPENIDDGHAACEMQEVPPQIQQENKE